MSAGPTPDRAHPAPPSTGAGGEGDAHGEGARGEGARGGGGPAPAYRPSRLRFVRIALLSPLLLAAVLLLVAAGPRNRIRADLVRWAAILEGREIGSFGALLRHHAKYMAFFKEYRTLFYYRVPAALVLGPLLRPQAALEIRTADIGPGLFLQHGFATIVHAHRIGRNCWINQQVTIGFTNRDDAPVIEDDVTIGAGAIVIGDVVVGRGTIVGAGAVVVKSVPPHVTVAGVPAAVVRRHPAAAPDDDRTEGGGKKGRSPAYTLATAGREPAARR